MAPGMQTYDARDGLPGSRLFTCEQCHSEDLQKISLFINWLEDPSEVFPRSSSDFPFKINDLEDRKTWKTLFMLRMRKSFVFRTHSSTVSYAFAEKKRESLLRGRKRPSGLPVFQVIDIAHFSSGRPLEDPKRSSRFDRRIATEGAKQGSKIESTKG